MTKTYIAIEKEAKKYFKHNDSSHGWDHTERVFALCLKIGKTEKANLKVLKIAALLHDIGRGEEFKSKGVVCHAQRGADLARQILEKYKFPEKDIEVIVHCIAAHRFRGKNVPSSIEAKILFDADKLDSIGAIGIGRDFLFAGRIGAKLYNDKFIVKDTKAYTKEDTAYREYAVKLKYVKNRMLTSEGKSIAQERHRFMKEFFERMKKEVKGTL